MSFGKIFAISVLAFEKIRNGVEPKTVDTHAEPEIENLEDGLAHRRIVEV